MKSSALLRLTFVLLVSVAMSIVVRPPVRAQDTEPIVAGQKVTLHSRIMNEDRRLWIFNPDSASSVQTPVIYLLDGDSYFLQTTGIVQFLSNNGKMPAMIVVGILNTNRTRDLTPLPPDTSLPGSGGADKLLQCLTDEIIPYIDSHYRTAPYRILVGHSFGGIFAVNAFLRRPEAFNSYIVISPSLWWGSDTLVKETRTFLRSHPKVQSSIYATIGDEGPRMVTPSLQLKDVFEANRLEGLTYKFKLMDEEDHGTIVLKTIYDGLEVLFDGWRVRGDLAALGMPGLEHHYRQLSEKYGYDVPIPESTVNNLGYQYLAMNRVDDAVEVLRWNVHHYPKSWNVYDSLGEALAKKGATEEAIENYERSISINPGNSNGLTMLKKLKGG